MRKSSVYLPDGLKRRLEAAARRAHRSEAELIREAIERLVTAEAPPAAVVPEPVPGRLVGVGVGPGAADLVTVRAVTALRRATVVLAPCTAIDSVGRAEAILREAVPEVVAERLVFAMAPRARDRTVALEAACARVVELLDAGEEVAFVTIGDPNVYSTFASVAAGVVQDRPATPVVTVPGVMAFQELAAKSGTVLVDGQQSLVVLPANSTRAPLADALQDATRAVVVYKGGGRLPEVAETIRGAARLDGSVLGELLGMQGERVVPVRDVADRPASYLSSIIVPARAGHDR